MKPHWKTGPVPRETTIIIIGVILTGDTGSSCCLAARCDAHGVWTHADSDNSGVEMLMPGETLRVHYWIEPPPSDAKSTPETFHHGISHS